MSHERPDAKIVVELPTDDADLWDETTEPMYPLRSGDLERDDEAADSTV